MNNRHPGLPPEIVTIILRHLRLSDLRQCLLVSSALNAAVQPLLCRFVRIQDHGVSFPYAEDNAPFLVNDAFPPDNPAIILHDLDCIEVDQHDLFPDPEWAVCRSNLPAFQISSCRVLVVNLGLPDVDFNIASVHSAPDIDDIPAQHHPPLSHPSSCNFIRTALGGVAVDKLVLRDVPLAYGRMDPDMLSVATAWTVQEVVVTFDATSTSLDHFIGLEKWRERYTCEEWTVRPCEEQIDGPVVYELESIFLPTAKDFTFVFWAPKPGVEVATECCNYLETIAADAGEHFPPCTCLSSEDHEEFDLDRHFSCWEEEFLEELAEAIVLHADTIRKVTVVNACAIVPTDSSREQTLLAISSGLATHSILEDRLRLKLRFLLAALDSEHVAQKVVDRIEFKYMKDWLGSTAWEDVFEWHEVKPWMRSRRQPLITEHFKPESPDTIKWRKEMDAQERAMLRRRRTSVKRIKPNKYKWRQ